jgi:preprotein translocase subunit YajC
MQILAQTTPAGGTTTPPPPPDGPPAFLQFVPIILLVVIFYFFMFRTKSNEKHKREDMLSKLKKGDEVQTIGGEYGRVMDTKDDRVLLKVDESSNTKIWYARSAIHRVMGDEKAKVEAK